MICDLQTIANKMREVKELCLVYHIRPDGDCVGTSYALAVALKKFGVRCDVVGADPVPNRQKYLTDKVRLDTLKNPAFCALDTVSPHRLGKFKDKPYTFVIDHHENNTIEADYKYVEPTAGACAEIVFKLIRLMNIEVTKEIADLLYTGLVCDTLCFRTSDTSVQSFEVATELAKCGASIFDIGAHNMLYKTRERLKLEDTLKRSFRFLADGVIGTGIILLQDLEAAHIADNELEGINSLIVEIEGLYIGTTIRELPDGSCRCSMRTKGKYKANKILEVFGGDGHTHAAVCEIKLGAKEARRVIESVCLKALEN